VTVYNAQPGSSAPVSEHNEALSAQVSVYNVGAPTARIEAISREVTVLNFQDPI
jgi:hypothetical protein